MNTANSISHEIAAVVRTDILRGRYDQGDRLPSERELAVRFSASRGAVREALSQLAQQGLIQIHPGGARVQPREAATLAVLGPLLALESPPDPELVDQFLEIFGVLSALTARRAIAKAGPQDLIRIQQRLVAFAQHADDPAMAEPCLRDLLETLADIDNNLVVRLIGNDLKAQFMQNLQLLGIKPKLKPGSRQELVKTLKTAVQDRNADLASAAFLQHFEQVRLAIRTALEASRHRDARGTAA